MPSVCSHKENTIKCFSPLSTHFSKSPCAVRDWWCTRAFGHQDKESFLCDQHSVTSTRSHNLSLLYYRFPWQRNASHGVPPRKEYNRVHLKSEEMVLECSVLCPNLLPHGRFSPEVQRQPSSVSTAHLQCFPCVILKSIYNQVSD